MNDEGRIRKKARAEALKRGEGKIDVEKLKETLDNSTQGPWHWVGHDYSMATLQGPAEDWDHVVSVSPCQACMDRARDAGDVDWKWGRCTAPSQDDAYIMQMAPLLAEAYVNNTKYPIEIEPHLYQYGEGVYVWFDEAGLVGGAANTLGEASRQMKLYLKNI